MDLGESVEINLCRFRWMDFCIFFEWI